MVGGTAGVVEGTAQGIKEAVEDTKEGVDETSNQKDTDMDTSYDVTEKREYNEAGEELEDAWQKIKAGAKAVANKVEDPDKDLDSEYQQVKTEEKME